LIGYLLRKRRIIVDYGERRAGIFWSASTRVEKWNDLAVSDRCKRNGTSWTVQGVLAVALYANKKIYCTTPVLDGSFGGSWIVNFFDGLGEGLGKIRNKNEKNKETC